MISSPFDRISQSKKQATSFQDYLVTELTFLSSSSAAPYQKPLMQDITRVLVLSSSEISGAHVCKEILLQTILSKLQQINGTFFYYAIISGSYSQGSVPEYTILNAVEELSTELSSDAIHWMCQSVMRTLCSGPVISSG